MEPPPLAPPPPAADEGEARTHSVIAWGLLPPVGSLVVLALVKDNPDTRFNAANATVVHGAMLAVWIVLAIAGGLIGALNVLSQLWLLLWIAVWVVGVVLAFQNGGRRFVFPVLSELLAAWIPTVESIVR